LAALAACDDGLCEGETLRARLGRASEGETLQLGECAVEGPLSIPAGVTLRGAGPGRTVVVGSGEESAIVLGSGATLSGLTVRVERGRALEARAARALTIQDVALEGPVRAEDAAELPALPSAGETATHGLLLVDAEAELERVTVRGFARFGALLVQSQVRWTSGDADRNRAVGVMVAGGSLVLEEVRVCGTLAGVGVVPTYAAVIRDGARLESRELEVCDSAGYGVLHDDAIAAHVDFVGHGNTLAALWAQRSPSFTLAGAGTLLEDNGLGGLLAIDVAELEVFDATIRTTRSLRRIEGAGSVTVGDGVHLDLATASGLRVEGLRLEDNGRAGLLAQIADGVLPSGVIGSVHVTSSGEAFGVVAQSESTLIASGPRDAAVERHGAAAANDESLANRLDVVSAVAPMFFPPPD
jgi:hypothetical protein